MFKNLVTLFLGSLTLIGTSFAQGEEELSLSPRPTTLTLWDNLGSNTINIRRYNTFTFYLIADDQWNRRITYGCYRNCVGVRTNPRTGAVSIYAGSSIPIHYNMVFGATNGFQTVYRSYSVNFR